MKKVIIVAIFILTVLVQNTFAQIQELWNGINIGMSVDEAKAILFERLGAIDVTSNIFGAGNWTNEHIIYYGHSPTNMRSYYREICLMTRNPSYRQSGSSNITLYHNQHNIIIGVNIDWASTNFPYLLENTRNNYGKDQIVEKNGILGRAIYHIWETDSRIIILTNFFIMATKILDKNWYYENIYTNGEIDSGINF